MKKILTSILLLIVNFYMIAQNFDYRNYTFFLNKYVTKNGNVNYEKIKENASELNQIINQFEKTQPTDKWSKNEKLTYFINSYNCHTIKLIIDNYPTKSIKDVHNAWDKKFIPFGNEKISLGHIEHKILRKMNEPRIHFAINCASYSCPSLMETPYLPETIEIQLTEVTKSFINDKSKNKISSHEIKISKIFDWFKNDFKTKNSSLIDFINKYSPITIDKNAKIKYLEYNWSLNK